MPTALLCLLILCSPGLQAQPFELLLGEWQINRSLSDNTDSQVEASMRAAGQRPQRSFFNRRTEEYYRGGPPEHALYDHMSYETRLLIRREGDNLHFTYGDDFERPVYLDGRSRPRVGLLNLEDAGDFSFGHWEGNNLLIEGRVRDGGFTDEHYSLDETAQRLTVTLHIRPRSFREPINIRRVYDRVRSD